MMQKYYFYQHNEETHCSIRQTACAEQILSFVWIDCVLEDLAHAEQWQQQIYAQSGLWLNEYHIEDIANIEHPSNFDTTQDYDLLIFRKLVTHDDGFKLAEDQLTAEKILMFDPSEFLTTPISLCIAPQVLISIRDPRNFAAKKFVERFQSLLQPAHPQPSKNTRLPSSPLDLSLRLLNVVIDRYLDIRLPLTQRVNFWQNALLQSSARFRHWQDLFQENMALQQIEYLCEEQMDVLQELRDDIMENQSQLVAPLEHERQDLTLVRVNDLLSHVERVQKHVTRLESMIKTAIDLHFSAISNQTNENMRILAIITAIFSPLTLLTGIYGMNFEAIPGLKNPLGFWIMLCVMLMTTVVLVVFFRRKRLMGSSQHKIADLLAQGQRLDFKRMK